MTITLDPNMPDLNWTSTLDRSLVHRDALGEVFLTDIARSRNDDDLTFHVAAQLPRWHAYYGDHLAQPTSYDPLLILEAARQAGLAGAHAFFGVPQGHKFILTHLGVRLIEPAFARVGTKPCPLHLHMHVQRRRERDGETTGLDYSVDIESADGAVASADVGLRFRSPDGYLTLRTEMREGRPMPSSATWQGMRGDSPATPYVVGRANTANVVLDSLTSHAERVDADLRVPCDHPSMFDHPQDHVPGMVLSEAARQLAYAAALELRGLSPARAHAVALAITFQRFGELDNPVTLTSSPSSAPIDAPGHLQVEVSARQAGAPIASASVVLARTPGPIR